MKRKRYVLKNHFQGSPKPTDFELIEEEIPPIKNGEILFEAVYLSIDPYMRPYSERLPLGSTMIGAQVSKVKESRNPDFKVGDHYVGNFGWTSHSILTPDQNPGIFQIMPPYKVPDFGGLSHSLALGALGMPGNTAWFGLTRICRPKSGETLVVTGAAGAVGSLVGQIGKILGLRVIGFTGSDEKVEILKKDFNFDYAYNYKNIGITEALKESAPNGVDCYFDNVGGVMSGKIMTRMNPRGRVAVCGSISSYNDSSSNLSQAPVLQPIIVFKELCVEGFLVTRWTDEWFDGINQMLKFAKEGDVKFKETVVEGFDNMYEALMKLFAGDNVGKLVVKACL